MNLPYVAVSYTGFSSDLIPAASVRYTWLTFHPAHEEEAMDRNPNKFDLSGYEAKVASARQERQQEELQLERLKIRLKERMQQAQETQREAAA